MLKYKSAVSGTQPTLKNEIKLAHRQEIHSGASELMSLANSPKVAVSYTHEDNAVLVPRIERLQFTTKRQPFFDVTERYIIEDDTLSRLRTETSTLGCNRDSCSW